MRILVKTSGDCLAIPEFYDELKPLDVAPNRNEIVVGAGSQINEEILKRGISIKFDKNGSRIHPSREAEQIAYFRILLNQQQVDLELFARGFWNTKTVLPIEWVDGERRHINGDDYVVRHHKEFDLVIIVTTIERVVAKFEKFSFLGNKMTIWSFPDA